MKVIIETIPHEQQRYDTCGDWWFEEPGFLQIRVSEMTWPSHEFLVAIHEFVEAWLCKYAGITEKEVTEFDLKFEGARHAFNYDEPGDDPMSPYQKQHCIATGIERILCGILEKRWKEYEDDVNSLSQAPSSPRPTPQD